MSSCSGADVTCDTALTSITPTGGTSFSLEAGNGQVNLNTQYLDYFDHSDPLVCGIIDCRVVLYNQGVCRFNQLSTYATSDVTG